MLINPKKTCFHYEFALENHLNRVDHKTILNLRRDMDQFLIKTIKLLSSKFEYNPLGNVVK